MKLHSRTSAYFVIISLVVFLIGGLIFPNLLRSIFYNQIDENLKEEKLLIEEAITESDSVPDFRSDFGHLIQVSLLRYPPRKIQIIQDTSMFDRSQDEFIHYRHLYSRDYNGSRGYMVNIFKPLKETDTLIAEIYISITILFFSLLLMLLLVNFYISRHAWVPFYRTLHQLGIYNINQEVPLRLEKSKISEFILLNQALEEMSDKIRQDYFSLKEFNENAAHELQTPLAIIKSKLDLLIQNEQLKEEQLKLISSVYDATTRISKLNQGLLLISKIENNQFPQSDEVYFEQILDRIFSNFEEIIELKKISIRKSYVNPIPQKMNKILAEILISNLVSNAIRYNIQGGFIEVQIENKTLTISNTGAQLNIDPRELFERFRKSDKSSESAGLGLAIVRKIVLLYKMKISYTYNDFIHTLRLSF